MKFIKHGKYILSKAESKNINYFFKAWIANDIKQYACYHYKKLNSENSAKNWL